MKLVLLERVENLGAMGDVVTVRPGYARNYLLPQEKALRATEANLARFEAERDALEKRNAERAAAAATDGEKIDGEKFVMIRQAGESGQLYGSVTSRDIAEIVAEGGVSVSRGLDLRCNRRPHRRSEIASRGSPPRRRIQRPCSRRNGSAHGRPPRAIQSVPQL